MEKNSIGKKLFASKDLAQNVYKDFKFEIRQELELAPP